MRSTRCILLFLPAALILLASVSASAWDKEEHRVLADSVFLTTLHACEPSLTREQAWTGGLTFGERVAQLAAKDLDDTRFHKRGASIMNQLATVTAERLASRNPGVSPVSSSDNVVAAFLVSHLKALRIASGQGAPEASDSPSLAAALLEEARAQGYLADAFAAGHVLSYNRLPFSFLQSCNRREAHDRHRIQGVFVVNARGEVWQTFGDGLLHWYPPTYRAVFDACGAALNEVLSVWFVSNESKLPQCLQTWLEQVAPGKTPQEAVDLWLSRHSGDEYYRDVRLPSLMCLPMPVAATWSYRTDSVDTLGARLRYHYPQLRETGLHDPDMRDIDARFLYSREAMPEWMIPEPLRTSSTSSTYEMIRSDPDWASVRFVQERYARPSFKGALLQVGGQLTVRKGDTRMSGSIGLGYGIWNDLILIKNVSIGATYFPGFCEANHHLLTSSLGLGFDLPGDAWVTALHLEGGLGVGLGEDFDDYGPVFALGVDSRVMPLRLTYAGVTCRIKYQWFSLDTPVSGPSVEFILQ